MFFTQHSASILFMNQSIYDSVNHVLSDKCIEFCGESNNCLNEYFESYEKRGGGRENTFSIMICSQLVRVLYSRIHLKYKSKSFYVLPHSIISLWFGFSIIILSNVCLVIVNQVTNFTNKFETKVTLINNFITTNSLQTETVRNRKNFQNNRKL